MAKIILASELAAIVTQLLTEDKEGDPYTPNEFIREIAEVVTSYCGGVVGGVSWLTEGREGDGANQEWAVAIRPSDNPFDQTHEGFSGTIWESYDPENER